MLLALIAMKALVWFGLLFIALTVWFAGSFGQWSVWIDDADIARPGKDDPEQTCREPLLDHLVGAQRGRF